jgi:hypothetical protein
MVLRIEIQFCIINESLCETSLCFFFDCRLLQTVQTFKPLGEVLITMGFRYPVVNSFDLLDYNTFNAPFMYVI